MSSCLLLVYLLLLLVDLSKTTDSNNIPVYVCVLHLLRDTVLIWSHLVPFSLGLSQETNIAP